MRPSATAGFRCGLILNSPVVGFPLALLPTAANSHLRLPQVKLPFEPLRRKARSNPTAIPSAIADGDADEAWDQFAENERLYGVRTDFDEEMCACLLFVFATFICVCVRYIHLRLCSLHHSSVRVCSLHHSSVCACVLAKCSCVCAHYIIHLCVCVRYIHSSARVCLLHSFTCVCVCSLHHLFIRACAFATFIQSFGPPQVHDKARHVQTFRRAARTSRYAL